ncbi:unnamed protein product [Trichobilharzia regenti]|nr:unnamed protein product [Trichobilharzia regenti]
MNWEKLFEKLFQQIGLKGYRKFSLRISDTTALQHQCALHEIELSTPTGKRFTAETESQYLLLFPFDSTIQNMAIMDFMAYQDTTIDFEVESSESVNAEMDSRTLRLSCLFDDK